MIGTTEGYRKTHKRAHDALADHDDDGDDGALVDGQTGSQHHRQSIEHAGGARLFALRLRSSSSSSFCRCWELPAVAARAASPLRRSLRYVLHPRRRLPAVSCFFNLSYLLSLRSSIFCFHFNVFFLFLKEWIFSILRQFWVFGSKFYVEILVFWGRNLKKSQFLGENFGFWGRIFHWKSVFGAKFYVQILIFWGRNLKKVNFRWKFWVLRQNFSLKVGFGRNLKKKTISGENFGFWGKIFHWKSVFGKYFSKKLIFCRIFS